ncbi:metallophosphoesterase family protein [Salibacterium halotolerans]|uniref:Serine/threonine protein phosphatase 1 n=1 Tax=Salibacterium halotolerans TaxID=1884432 RepID=A0A1I5PFT7_9BACI|nr:metallophosphoesterase family protein [Salibacterium halotolerans]SFP32972.1 serine/threonine protein phosphatase 1 [Salibacterium halotolerans]
MTRDIFISDIHGQFEAFVSLLHRIDYQPEQDRLFLLGDFIDRGPQSFDVIRYILDLKNQEGADVTCLMGNHEDMMLQAFQDEDADGFSLWMENGGGNTLRSYVGEELAGSPFDEIVHAIRRDFPEHLDFMDNLQRYAETPEHILVHAGIDPFAEDWKESEPRTFVWIRSPFLEKTHNAGKTVIFGHTPTPTLHENAQPWFQSDKIGIDGGAGFNMQLNALIYENDTYTVISEPVQT